jgi:hypothetical protein
VYPVLSGIKNAEDGHTFYKIQRGGVCMSKGSKPKKQKVPKLTEAEYAAYLSALRELSEGNNPVISPKQNEGKDE